MILINTQSLKKLDNTVNTVKQQMEKDGIAVLITQHSFNSFSGVTNVYTFRTVGLTKNYDHKTKPLLFSDILFPVVGGDYQSACNEASDFIKNYTNTILHLKDPIGDKGKPVKRSDKQIRSLLLSSKLMFNWLNYSLVLLDLPTTGYFPHQTTLDPIFKALDYTPQVLVIGKGPNMSSKIVVEEDHKLDERNPVIYGVAVD